MKCRMQTSRISPQVVSLPVVLAIVATWAFADPPDFKRVQITDTPEDLELNPRINDLGRIVFSRRIGGFFEEKHEEIFLYALGGTSRLTEDEVQDRRPDINNGDSILWCRLDGPDGKYGPTSEIARWAGNGVERLTDDGADDFGPRINSEGQAVWYKYNYAGCEGSNRVLEFFDGETIHDITDGSYSDQSCDINDAGVIVWGRYDFCDDGIVYSVMMYANAEITELSAGPESFGPRVNNNGVVAWSEEDGIVTWTDGVIVPITDNGTSPYINSRGDIALARYDDEKDVWQTWLCIGGDIRLIVKSDKREAPFDMNEYGDIITLSYETDLSASEVVLFQRLADGDMNCDELVDFDDIDGFVAAITNRAKYEELYPDCDWWLADMTGNRVVDFDDIDGFVDCLIHGGCGRE